MKLSVVIPCYNSAETLGAQLEAFTRQEWDQPWELVLADNRSTDESRAIAVLYQKRMSNLIIVDAFERQGQPYALNTGVAAARGQSVAFSDADDEVGLGWVAAMGDALTYNDFVACRVDTAKLNPSWVYESLGGHRQQHSLQTIPYPPYLPFAGGGTLGVKKYLHEKVGGFDETLPYVHDADYCFKVQKLDVKLEYVHGAVTHLRLRHKPWGVFHQARHWAQYNVKVYKRYRYSNGPDLKYPWLTYAYRWLALLRLLPRIRSLTARVQIMWILGYQIGLLHGSLEERVPPVPN